jgi:hypothetical protein
LIKVNDGVIDDHPGMPEAPRTDVGHAARLMRVTHAALTSAEFAGALRGFGLDVLGAR